MTPVSPPSSPFTEGVSVVERVARPVENVSCETSPLDGLLASVAEEFRVSPQGLRGPSRCAYLAHPRHAFCWLASGLGWSSVRIGKFIGRDHSTVLYSMKAARLRAGKDVHFYQAVNRIRLRAG